ncbi:MAG: hypothetical protein EA339_03835 [Rhodobacteraceae bacterium]|nr:MAG: hypothetical protein EA339_03835 [Paracoccaceae bacterium]
MHLPGAARILLSLVDPKTSRTGQAPMPQPPAAKTAPPGQRTITTYLQGLSEQIAAAGPPALPSVLISGTMRCGKTRVARALAARTGHVIVETDQIRNALYGNCNEADRRRVMKYTFRKLLLRWPKGILVEGTALMDTPCELPIWAHRRGLKFVTIGYSDGSAEAKTRDLLAFRATHQCWTRKVMDDAGVARLARKILNRSKELEAFCAAHGMDYHHLESSRFHAECARIAQEIETDLRQTQQGAPSGVMARLAFWKRRPR